MDRDSDGKGETHIGELTKELTAEPRASWLRVIPVGHASTSPAACRRWIMRRRIVTLTMPRRTSLARAEQRRKDRAGATGPSPLCYALQFDRPSPTLSRTSATSKTGIDPRPLPSCRLALHHRGCKRREVEKAKARRRATGTQQRRRASAAQGPNASASAARAQGNGQRVCPCPCKSTRIVLASPAHAD